MTWIKLAIHRRHSKVLRIADLTGTGPIDALAASIDWFRWVDEHAEDADMAISLASFREVTAWPDDRLADAMRHRDVDWVIKGGDGLLRPTRFESHFSASAKRRAIHAKQTAHRRARTVRNDTAPDQKRSDSELRSDNAGACAPGVSIDDPPTAAVFDAFVGWADATGGSFHPHRGDYGRFSAATGKWAESKHTDDGKPLAWHVAALACIAAARGRGLAFKSIGYALTVLGGMMAEYERGIAPSAPIGRSESADDGAAERGMAAGLARAAARKARAV